MMEMRVKEGWHSQRLSLNKLYPIFMFYLPSRSRNSRNRMTLLSKHVRYYFGNYLFYGTSFQVYPQAIRPRSPLNEYEYTIQINQVSFLKVDVYLNFFLQSLYNFKSKPNEDLQKHTQTYTHLECNQGYLSIRNKNSHSNKKLKYTIFVYVRTVYLIFIIFFLTMGKKISHFRSNDVYDDDNVIV